MSAAADEDLVVSSIGLGCVTFGREIDQRRSRDVLDRAMDRGIRLLDTAAVYGDGASEEIIGRWMRSRGARNHVVLATKVSGRLASDAVGRSVEASLRRLAADRIDLLQAHDWDPHTPLEETLEAFEGLARRGMVGVCGCSNWGVAELERALSLAAENGWKRLESVQPIYNLADRRAEHELFGFCGEHGLGVMTYSPLGAGFLTGKYSPGGPIPSGTRFDVKPAHQDIYFTELGFRAVEELRAAAAEVGLPMARLALAWVFRRRGITSVLIGARTPEQVDQAFEALHTAHSPEHQELLDRL
jgi:aryl-alcohol dehydrogenase-like predicted oxidoreductase